MKKIILIASLAFVTLNLTSCRDSDLEPTLSQQKELDASLVSVTDLSSYMNGILNKMRDTNYYGRDYFIYGEVRSDNTYSNANSNRYVLEAEMNYTPDQGNMPATWYRIYEVIGRANLVINKYEGKGGYTPFRGDEATIKHYVGQAYLLRAMAHFDLTRIFGLRYVNGQGGMSSLAVPYVTLFKGDAQNPYPARNTNQEVYDLAKADLEAARGLMTSAKDTSVSYYVNSPLVDALLSRMALYFGDTATAEAAAKRVIDSNKYSVLPEGSFVASWKGQTSPNWIFSLYSNTSNEALGSDGLAYIYRLPANGSGYGDVVGLGNLYNAFESSDIRVSPAMSSAKAGDGDGEFRNIGKFPDTVNSGDAIPILRYEEVILNYAEACLANGKSATALTYLNMIPAQRGASLYTAATIDNILLERRKEFAFEGQRFFDLVRNGRAIQKLDNTRQNIKATIAAGDPKTAFPIPNTEMGANANMVQNPGY